MLRDSSRSGGGSVEDGSEPSSFHSIRGTNDSFEGGEGMNYGSPIIRSVDASPLPSIGSLIDLELVKVAQNEQINNCFVKSFRRENGWDPNDREIRDHINFQNHPCIHDQNYLSRDS